MVYLFILITLSGTVAGQLILKSGVIRLGEIPSSWNGAIYFLLRALSHPAVILSLFLAFIAALAWIAALSKAELSFVYPFMSLAPPLVLLSSSVFLREPVSWLRWVGVAIISLGVLIVSRS